MSVENELKKLTTAVEANTAALLNTAGAPAPTAPLPPVPSPAPAPFVPPQPPVTSVPIPPHLQPVTPVPIPAPATQALAPVTPGAPQMDQATAQAELTAIVQNLGDPAAVQAVMAKYGSTRLNEIPVENLFSMVQECKGLVTS